MKALITGANGQIGWELQQTIPDGWNIVALTHEDPAVACGSPAHAPDAFCRYPADKVLFGSHQLAAFVAETGFPPLPPRPRDRWKRRANPNPYQKGLTSCRRQAFMNEMPAWGEMPEFEEPTFETPEWVKEIDAQREARMQEMPAFEEPTFETPEWVKEIDAQREAGLQEMPAFDEMPAFETPDFKEMEQSREQWLKESDERRAERDKAFQERRAASKKRHEEFMKKFRKDSTEEVVEEAPAEKQS